MASKLAQQFRPRRKNYGRELLTRAANYKALYKEASDQLSTAQASLAQWQSWAQEYKEATKHAYDEATAAEEDRRRVETTLLEIQRIITCGDRGAITALSQIQNLCDDYFAEQRNSE